MTREPSKKPETPAAPRPGPAYEPPRILAKRPVERVTLLSGEIGPGEGIGGD